MNLNGLVIAFPARVSETGKLYGSITTQAIAEAISKKMGIDIARRHVDTQPLRSLGEHKVHVRLTVDLVPEVTVIVHREGEAVKLPSPAEVAPAPAAEASAEMALEEELVEESETPESEAAE